MKSVGLERSKRFLSYAWVRKPTPKCCRLLDDRLIQIRPGNLKVIADTLDLSSNYGQTNPNILTEYENVRVAQIDIVETKA
jgi:hypothetical protein